MGNRDRETKREAENEGEIAKDEFFSSFWMFSVCLQLDFVAPFLSKRNLF